LTEIVSAEQLHNAAGPDVFHKETDLIRRSNQYLRSTWSAGMSSYCLRCLTLYSLKPNHITLICC